MIEPEEEKSERYQNLKFAKAEYSKSERKAGRNPKRKMLTIVKIIT